MHKKYRVTLSMEEREQLKALLSRGKSDVRRSRSTREPTAPAGRTSGWPT